MTELDGTREVRERLERAMTTIRWMAITMALLFAGFCGLAMALGGLVVLHTTPTFAVGLAGGAFSVMSGIGLTVQGQLRRA